MWRIWRRNWSPEQRGAVSLRDVAHLGEHLDSARTLSLDLQMQFFALNLFRIFFAAKFCRWNLPTTLPIILLGRKIKFVSGSKSLYFPCCSFKIASSNWRASQWTRAASLEKHKPRNFSRNPIYSRKLGRITSDKSATVRWFSEQRWT